MAFNKNTEKWAKSGVPYVKILDMVICMNSSSYHIYQEMIS